ncbi:ornithine cyclodeaminase family protein [Rhodococcus wratislaviensis]|uniref:Ornithine cyclodeaminase n=1 Tax=Rhodococcus wratislaviensis NBRC 100605 TaxID=1219028 RepID=X0PW91_RHOWR|nr:ornithine cyclodeaminase family protein [Rhodococcus wratislaviensis]GAF47538.1 ornithine cyclodeaminase [Rhodococcus wratislaviensis NBRC 100605]
MQNGTARGQNFLYLTKQEVIDLGITREEVVDITRSALVEHGNGRYEMPAKIGVHPFPDVFFHAMPAFLPALNAVGMKWIESYPNNPSRFGIPQITGLQVMNDVESGAPVALFDSTWLTAQRTPAVTMLAAEALHPGAKTFAMIGCGVQGREHVVYADTVLNDLETITVYDVREEAIDRLIADLQPRVDVELLKGVSLEAVVKESEVLSSATIIVREPLAAAKDEWVSAGQTILPCDLNTFWEPAISRRSRYIVDSIDEHELFADMGYFPDGLPAIAAETGQVLAGIKPGRTSSDEVIVNSNIGMAVCDIALGDLIRRRAEEHGVGTVLPL